MVERQSEFSVVSARVDEINTIANYGIYFV
jgi:hypothetical protein